MEIKVNIVEKPNNPRSWKTTHLPKSTYGMEAVHNPGARPWISPKIHLRDHFAKFSTLVAESRVPGLKRSDLKSVESKKVKDLVEYKERDVISEDVFDEIVDNCDISNFT
jgi:hypothetical protein